MKVLINKKTGEYGCYRDGIIWGTSNPHIYPDTANEEELKRYAKMFDDAELDMKDYEFKEIEITIK